jgi:hypothetical protein
LTQEHILKPKTHQLINLSKAMKKIALLVAIAACTTTLASAQIIVTTSTTAPTPGTDDISQLANDGSVTNDGGHAVWSDQYGQGQSFTTSGTSAAYQLNSVTVYANGTGGNGSAGPLILDLGTYTSGADAASSSFTVLNSYTASSSTDVSSIAGQPNSGEWITFTLTTPIILSANTTYGFAVGSTGAGLLLGQDASSTYTGGTAFSTTPNGNGPGDGTDEGGLRSTPTGINTVNAFNRVFDVSLTATTPEPSTYVLLGFGLLSLVVLGKRKLKV